MLFWIVSAIAQDANTPPRSTETAFPTIEVDGDSGTSSPIPQHACVDDDGDVISWRVSGPSWAVLDGHALSITPRQHHHGRHTVDLWASDGQVESLCGTWVVVVTDRIPPTVTLTGPGDVDPGEAFGVIVAPSERLAWLDPIDFDATGATVLQVREAPDGISLLVQGDGSADIDIVLPAGAIEDLAGNPSVEDFGVNVPLAPQLEMEGLPLQEPTGCSHARVPWTLFPFSRR